MEIKKIDLDQPSTSEVADSPASKNKFTTPLLIILALILGVSSGAILKNLKSGSGLGGGSGVKAPGDSSTIKVGDVFGAKDESDFPDQAIGILEEGGMDGEGTHKLLRPGGVSQTAYLTSSVLDLDQFVGFKITVWAETFSAQKAGWLMDVGRVKVEELNPTPFEE
ncbi:hypothetical protein KJ953_04770 [Patescibacteria group bacterium]|nr:hypothetical protein [Patescibacteria group bacterium]MBU1256219.1 hypothetical protein [Patescibacteria group bacterium]MBU1457759.1 hypothetical protein [Patescibacteria group bacterium]